ncbi:MAG: glycine cleavage system protein GcvH [candidate division Zixibacteria bacterium]|nr:glycine cleavage system protein GcvH [candidate division Zixibacteria bacterium]
MSVEELKYTKEHEWIHVEGDIITVGITDFAQGELGDVVFVELPEVGTVFSQSESFGTIEAVKTVADLYSPVTGEIVEVNGSLESDPGIVNSDPLGEGWFVKIKMSDSSELDNLLSYDDYIPFTKG